MKDSSKFFFLILSLLFSGLSLADRKLLENLGPHELTSRAKIKIKQDLEVRRAIQNQNIQKVSLGEFVKDLTSASGIYNSRSVKKVRANFKIRSENCVAWGSIAFLEKAKPKKGYSSIIRVSKRECDTSSLQKNNPVEGIFLVTKTNGKIPQKVLESEEISGVHLRLRWEDVEAKPRKYNFEQLLTQLDLLSQHNKKVLLTIQGGIFTPEWVYDEGVPILQIDQKRYQIKAGRKSPLVWNNKYIFLYNRLISVLGKELRSKPKLNKTIVMVKMGGINLCSAETRIICLKTFSEGREINGEYSSSQNGQNDQRDVAKIYYKNGYRPQKILWAADKLIGHLKKTFPRKVIGLAALAGSAAFPNYDNKGNMTKGNTVSFEISRLLLEQLGSRGSVNTTVLVLNGGTPEIATQAAIKYKGTTGFQISEQYLGHPSCPGVDLEFPDRATPCQPQNFKRAINQAIKKGASFIEIFESNLDSYPNLIKRLDSRLNFKPKD